MILSHFSRAGFMATALLFVPFIAQPMLQENQQTPTPQASSSSANSLDGWEFDEIDSPTAADTSLTAVSSASSSSASTDFATPSMPTKEELVKEFKKLESENPTGFRWLIKTTWKIVTAMTALVSTGVSSTLKLPSNVVAVTKATATGIRTFPSQLRHAYEVVHNMRRAPSVRTTLRSTLLNPVRFIMNTPQPVRWSMNYLFCATFTALGRFLGVVQISPESAPLLYSMLERAAKVQGLPVPPARVVYAGTEISHLLSHCTGAFDFHCNAFAGSTVSSHAVACVGKDLIETPFLTPKELEAIMCHEMRHIKQGASQKIALAIWLTTLFVAIYAVAFHAPEALREFIIFTFTHTFSSIIPNAACILPALFISTLSQIFEIDADLSTVETYGEAIASAIQKLPAIMTGKRRIIADLFATHPSTQTRTELTKWLPRASNTLVESTMAEILEANEGSDDDETTEAKATGIATHPSRQTRAEHTKCLQRASNVLIESTMAEIIEANEDSDDDETTETNS